MLRPILLLATVLGACSEPHFSKDADAGGMSLCHACEAPALCVPERRECVNFCEIPAEIPGSGPSFPQILCGGELKDVMTGELHDLGFTTTCTNTCLLTCRWQNWFCAAGIDCASACGKAEVQRDCDTACGADAESLTCQREKCLAVRTRPCVEDASLCPDGIVTPACGDVTCSNDCSDPLSAQANAFDGFCDDGAYAFSETDLCKFGTDCADCGPRAGKARSVDLENIRLGDPCPNSARCAGRSSDYSLNTSWCLDVGNGTERCMKDCSGDDESCDPGFSCEELSNTANADLLDRDGRRGKVCFPKGACL